MGLDMHPRGLHNLGFLALVGGRFGSSKLWWEGGHNRPTEVQSSSPPPSLWKMPWVGLQPLVKWHKNLTKLGLQNSDIYIIVSYFSTPPLQKNCKEFEIKYDVLFSFFPSFKTKLVQLQQHFLWLACKVRCCGVPVATAESGTCHNG